MGRSAIGYVLCAVALAFPGGEAAAQTATTPSGWTFDLGFYGWMPATSGTLDVRGREATIDQSFLDTLHKADTLLGLMGHAEAHRDAFSGILDFVYTKIGFKQTAVGPLSAKPTSTMAIVDVAGAYRFGRWWLDNTGTRTWSIEGLAGGRYNSIGSTLDFQPVGGIQPASLNQSKDWIDPFIGLRISAKLSQSWEASLRGDIGGFGVSSDLTWQAIALVGYRFRLLGANAEAGFGYRALSWRFSNGSGAQQFKWNATLHGPILGLAFRF